MSMVSYHIYLIQSKKMYKMFGMGFLEGTGHFDFRDRKGETPFKLKDNLIIFFWLVEKEC